MFAGTADINFAAMRPKAKSASLLILAAHIIVTQTSVTGRYSATAAQIEYSYPGGCLVSSSHQSFRLLVDSC